MSIDSSVDNAVSKVFDNFKRVTPALLSLAIITGLVLFLPEAILIKMSLDTLPDIWKRIIGIVFLLCVALMIAIAATAFYTSTREKLKRKRFIRIQRKRYLELDENLKRIICDMLHSKDKAIKLIMNSGDTVYLVNNLFIHQPQQVVPLGWNDEIELVYVPELWLIDLYKKEPELFRL